MPSQNSVFPSCENSRPSSLPPLGLGAKKDGCFRRLLSKGEVSFSFAQSYMGNQNEIVTVTEREDAKYYKFDFMSCFKLSLFHLIDLTQKAILDHNSKHREYTVELKI